MAATKDLDLLFGTDITTIGGVETSIINVANLTCFITHRMACNEWTFVPPSKADSFKTIFSREVDLANPPNITTAQYLELVAATQEHLDAEQFAQLSDPRKVKADPSTQPCQISYGRIDQYGGVTVFSFGPPVDYRR